MRQETGDNYCVDLYSSLHFSMEHIFSRYAIAAAVSAVV